MTLSWDPDDERVVIEVFPFTEAAVVSPEQVDQDFEEPEPEEVFLVRITPGLARAFVKRAEQVLDAGRPELPVLRQPDRPRRSPVRARQRLPPPGPRDRPDRRGRRPAGRPGAPRPDHAGLQRDLPRGDRRRAGRLQAGRGGAAALGLPRRHPRRPRGGGVRRLGGAGLGHRAAHVAGRRAARARACCRSGRRSTPTRTAVDSGPRGALPEGYLPVFDALDDRDRDVSLIHEDTAALRRMAVFDVIVNNADRKGGHVLAMPGGHRYGVDHGVTFHHEPKLRTVLWGWARRGRSPGRRGSTAVARRDRWRRATPAAAAATGCLGRAVHATLEIRRPRTPAAAPLLARGGACRAPPASWPGDPVAALLTADRPPIGFRSMRSWPLRRFPPCPRSGPPVAVHDTATGALVVPGPRARPASTSAASRPTTPPTSGHAATYVALRPAQPGLAQRRPRGHLRPERHRRRRPAARARREGARRLGRAGRARDRAVPRTTCRRCGCCRPTHYIGAVGVDPAGDRDDRAAAGGRRDLPRRRRPLLLRRPPTPPSARSRGYDRDAMLRALRRARRRPRPRGQEGPARLRRVARRATGRAVLGEPVRPGPARLAHRVRRDRRWTTSALPSTSRAAAATWSSRTTRCAPATPRWPSPARRSPRPTCTPAWSATTARRCRSPRATWSSSRRSATATSTRWRSGSRCCATTTAATGSGPTHELWAAVDSLADWRRALSLGAGAPAAPGGRRRSWPRWPTTSTRPAPSPPSTPGSHATLGTDGLADTSDPEAAVDACCRCSTQRSGLPSGDRH